MWLETPETKLSEARQRHQRRLIIMSQRKPSTTKIHQQMGHHYEDIHREGTFQIRTIVFLVLEISGYQDRRARGK